MKRWFRRWRFHRRFQPEVAVLGKTPVRVTYRQGRIIGVEMWFHDGDVWGYVIAKDDDA
jgi:hypothetical protein